MRNEVVSAFPRRLSHSKRQLSTHNPKLDNNVRCIAHLRHVRKSFLQALRRRQFLLSIIGFAGSIAVARFQFPGGYLADKHGGRWLVATMTFGLAIGTLFFIFVTAA